MTPLPFKPLQGGFGERLRTHLFVNAGNLGYINSCRSNMHTFLARKCWNFQSNFTLPFILANFRESAQELFQGYRWSYGIGLLVKLGVAQLELNYCVPCRAHASDRYTYLLKSAYLLFVVYLRNCLSSHWHFHLLF